jgi:hypothetical protein
MDSTTSFCCSLSLAAFHASGKNKVDCSTGPLLHKRALIDAGCTSIDICSLSSLMNVLCDDSRVWMVQRYHYMVIFLSIKSSSSRGDGKISLFLLSLSDGVVLRFPLTLARASLMLASSVSNVGVVAIECVV